jgi:hypothetical protein
METELRTGRKEMRILSLVVVSAVFVLMTVSLVSAEFWACFDRGEIIDFCGDVPDRTCSSSNGCSYCMSQYVEEDDCYWQGNFNVCNRIAQECSIGGGGNDGPGPGFDQEPPEFTLIQPEEGGVYSSRSLNVIFDMNEKGDVYFMDNIRRPGRFSRICNDCMSYDRRRSFNEGFNDITFKFHDVVSNTGFHDVTFFIDSKKPRISRTNPRARSFASGMFDVEFREDFPEELTLFYGNDGAEGVKEYMVDLEGECVEERGRTKCEAEVVLDEYDGESIEYWFELTDIAGSFTESRKTELNVDTTPPQVNLNWEQEGNSVKFLLEVDEMNFDEATYEVTSDRRPRERRLCSRLRDDMCMKSIRLRGDGDHDITIRVRDEAGNSIEESLTVSV